MLQPSVPKYAWTQLRITHKHIFFLGPFSHTLQSKHTHTNPCDVVSVLFFLLLLPVNTGHDCAICFSTAWFPLYIIHPSSLQWSHLLPVIHVYSSVENRDYEFVLVFIQYYAINFMYYKCNPHNFKSYYPFIYLVNQIN